MFSSKSLSKLEESRYVIPSECSVRFTSFPFPFVDSWYSLYRCGGVRHSLAKCPFVPHLKHIFLRFWEEFIFIRLFISYPFERSSPLRIIIFSSSTVISTTTTLIGLACSFQDFDFHSIHFRECSGSCGSGIVVFLWEVHYSSQPVLMPQLIRRNYCIPDFCTFQGGHYVPYEMSGMFSLAFMPRKLVYHNISVEIQFAI